jgi:hypothetical protein
MLRHDVVAKIRETLIRLPCNRGTRSWRTARLRLRVRWMPKWRKAWSCTFKARNTARDVHAAKADAASAIANSTCHVSATTEPTAVETTATGEVTATTKSSTHTTTVAGRPCYGAQRHEYDANC